MPKVIITVALTGGIHGKEANPNLPEQPEEIIQQALECRDAGAAVMHVHARDQTGKVTSDVEVFRQIHDGIRARSDAIVQISTGGGLGLSVEERLEITTLRPELCSLNMSAVCFTFGGKETFFQNFPSDIEAFARRMRDLGIKPELECYNLESLEEIDNLIKKDLLTPPYLVNLVLHSPAQGAIRGTPRNLMAMVDRLPKDAIFNVCSMGPTQLPITTMALILGGNIRTGMEDNVYYARGRPARNNAELVTRMVRIIKELNLEVATPDEAREMLGLGQAVSV